jgi:hypothetical protein
MRRIPLTAVRACATLLLVGCQSTLASTLASDPPPPPAPSLSFEVAGPSQIDTQGSYSWEAIAFGGSGAYQYRWEVSRQPGQTAATATQRQLSLLVAETDGDLSLKVTVTSGDQVEPSHGSIPGHARRPSERGGRAVDAGWPSRSALDRPPVGSGCRTSADGAAPSC